MIPLLNLKKQAKVYKKEIIKGIKNNIDSGEFVLGKNINILERKLSYLTNSSRKLLNENERTTILIKIKTTSFLNIKLRKILSS